MNKLLSIIFLAASISLLMGMDKKEKYRLAMTSYYSGLYYPRIIQELDNGNISIRMGETLEIVCDPSAGKIKDNKIIPNNNLLTLEKGTIVIPDRFNNPIRGTLIRNPSQNKAYRVPLYESFHGLVHPIEIDNRTIVLPWGTKNPELDIKELAILDTVSGKHKMIYKSATPIAYLESLSQKRVVMISSLSSMKILNLHTNPATLERSFIMSDRISIVPLQNGKILFAQRAHQLYSLFIWNNPYTNDSPDDHVIMENIQEDVCCMKELIDGRIVVVVQFDDNYDCVVKIHLLDPLDQNQETEQEKQKTE